jgi:endonuclease/exonuclease/phosphatase family metal-dependent hydrolase
LGAITGHTDLRARRRGGEEPEAVRRGLLQVEVPRAGGALTLFVVHLKSRLAVDKDDPRAEDQRVAEAQAVRDRILALFPEPSAERFLVLGDFNDLPGSRTLQAVETRGKIKIAAWLDAADSRGHGWTHAYASAGLYSRFDHAFVSGGLAERVVRAWIGDDPETARASDHRPLVIELRGASGE